MTPRQAEIRSPNGGRLTFTVLEMLAHDDIRYRTEVEYSEFRGAVTTYSYVNGHPGPLFDAIDQDWRGSTGEKVWESLGSELRMTAAVNSKGDVILKVEMRDDFRGCTLTVPLVLEGGSIQRMALDLRALFDAHGS